MSDCTQDEYEECIEILSQLVYLESEGFVHAEHIEHDDGGEIRYHPIGEAWLPDEGFLKSSPE